MCVLERKTELGGGLEITTHNLQSHTPRHTHQCGRTVKVRRPIVEADVKNKDDVNSVVQRSEDVRLGCRKPHLGCSEFCTT